MPRTRLRDWPIRVYRYDASVKGGVPEALWDTSRKMNQLWNALVAAHEESRNKVAEIFKEHPAEDDSWGKLQAGLKGVQAKRKQEFFRLARKASRITDHDLFEAAFAGVSAKLSLIIDDQTLLAAAQSGLGSLKAFAASRRSVTIAVKEIWKEFEGRCAELVEESGLNWETGPELLDRFRIASRMATERRRADGSPGWPRTKKAIRSVMIPHRFTGGGKPAGEIFRQALPEKPHRLLLRAVPQEAYNVDDAEHRRLRRSAGLFSLETAEGQKTAIHFRTVVHRPIPASAIVKKAIWRGRRNLFGWSWSLSIVCEIPPGTDPSVGAVDRVAAIDFGWRKMGDYLRVATIADNCGNLYELRLPLEYRRKKSQKARFPIPDCWLDLQKLDEGIGSGVEQAKQAVKEALHGPAELPEVLAWVSNKQAWDRTRQKGLLSLGESIQGELEKLELARTQVGHAQHPELLSALQSAKEVLSSRKLDNNRLRRKKVALSERLNLRRREYYRIVAALLARTYPKILLPADLDLKGMREQKDTEKSWALRHGDRYGQMASVHELATSIENAAGKWQAEIIKKQVKNKTAACHRCGHITESSAALVRECPACGAKWDIDVNSVRNYLKGEEQGPAFTWAIPTELARILVPLLED